MPARLSLEHITAWGLPPPALVDLAASLDCEAISLFVEAPVPGSAGPALSSDPALRKDVRARLDDSGVRMHTVECFALNPDTDVGTYAPALAAGAELGAVAATAIVFDPDGARVTDRLGQLGELARSFDLDVNVEFIAMSELRSLGEAVALVQKTGLPGMAVVVDALHWTRSGGTADQLRSVDPALIGAI